MTYDNGNGFADELFESLFSRYQIGLETTIRINNFIFDSVQLFYYECHKINFKRGTSYIESLGWIKCKKAKINPKNGDGKCFQYAATLH